MPFLCPNKFLRLYVPVSVFRDKNTVSAGSYSQRVYGATNGGKSRLEAELVDGRANEVTRKVHRVLQIHDRPRGLVNRVAQKSVDDITITTPHGAVSDGAACGNVLTLSPIAVDINCNEPWDRSWWARIFKRS